MCGECSQCLGHTGFAPTHSMCTFPVYCVQAPGCSAGELSKAGPGLRALPRSKLLRFRFLGTPQRHRLGWACILCPSQVWAAQATRYLAIALSPSGRCVLSPPHSQPLSFLGALQGCHLSCALCLLWGADFSQMSTIQDPRKTWLATGSLLTVWWRMPSLGLRFPLTFRLPASLPPAGGGTCPQLASSPLVFTQFFVLWAGQVVPYSFSRESSLSLFPSLWLSHSLGCYLTLAPSDCPQGIQAQSLP